MMHVQKSDVAELPAWEVPRYVHFPYRATFQPASANNRLHMAELVELLRIINFMML